MGGWVLGTPFFFFSKNTSCYLKYTDRQAFGSSQSLIRYHRTWHLIRVYIVCYSSSGLKIHHKNVKWNLSKLRKSKGTVNVLKCQMLYSILFWLKFCFLCIFLLKCLVEWQTVKTVISLLLQEQSDLSLYCLHIAFCQNFRTFTIGINHCHAE